MCLLFIFIGILVLYYINFELSKNIIRLRNIFFKFYSDSFV